MHRLLSVFRLCSVILVLALLLPAPFTVAHGDARITGPAAARADAATGRLIFLPLVLKPAGPPPPGIAGRVTIAQAPAAGIPLDLRLWNGQAWSEYVKVTTAADGRYRFTGAASLVPGQKYSVVFGPNKTNPNFVFGWKGPNITSYTAGAEQAGGDFDIADVKLVSPSAGATVPLPVTFEWQGRGVPGDSYAVGLLDTSGNYLGETRPLATEDWTTVVSLPAGIACYVEHRWYVIVYAAPDSYGESFADRAVTFTPDIGGGGCGGGGESLLPRNSRPDPASLLR